MDKRSLLGGAKRQQEVRQKRESERAWRNKDQKADSVAESAETAESAASPADVAATDTHAPGQELQFDLHWDPDQPEIGQNTETPLRLSSLVPEESKPIEWKLGDNEPTDQAQSPGSRSESSGQAPTAVPPQTDGSEISSELLSVTAREMRERQLARIGWWLLVGTLALAVIVLMI